MDKSQAMRQSGRRKCRPVEYWNFETPEEAAGKGIIYNELELTKLSIFQPFSLSYHTDADNQSNSTTTKGRPKAPGTAARTGEGHSALTSRHAGADAVVVVNGEEPSSSWPSAGLARKKERVEGQEAAGKGAAQALSNGIGIVGEETRQPTNSRPEGASAMPPPPSRKTSDLRGSAVNDSDKAQQGQEKPGGGGGDGDGGGTATTSRRARRRRGRRSKNPPAPVTAGQCLEQQVEVEAHPHQEDTLALTQAAGNARRSSRVRTKPLEYWNFEKVEVVRQEDGEVKLIHKKQDATMHIQTKVVDYTAALGSETGQGVTLSDDLSRNTTKEAVTQKSQVEKSRVTSHLRGKPRLSSKKSLKTGSKDGGHPALSPSQGKRTSVQDFLSSQPPNHSPAKSLSKRKLFSPRSNYFEEPAEEEEESRKPAEEEEEEESRKPAEEEESTKIRVGDKMLTVVKTVKFSDLRFVALEKEDYRCYVAHCLKTPDSKVAVSYLFLQRGKLVINLKSKYVVYVMAGCGVLSFIKEEQGTTHHLKPKVVVQGDEGSKLALKKDGRCEMLKLHLCLVNHSGSGDVFTLDSHPDTPISIS